MAIRLFAHTLLKAPGANERDLSFASRPLDLGRWMLGGLMVRREPVGWGIREAPARSPAPGRRDPQAGDSIWADTQPCWRE